jgi:hypothetical protein
MSLARGSVARSSRVLDLSNPASWEFSGFSQNGEDGIIEVLLQHIREPNRYFVEIGSSDGLENNTSWLSLVHRYSGLWIEADQVSAARARELFAPLNHGVQLIGQPATPANVSTLLERARVRNPDLLSLDIDSYDYFVGEAIFAAGMRPKLFVVEYNSAFGPSASLAVAFSETVKPHQSLAEKLAYGCSLGAWKALFAREGYQFVTVERNGVNAFFVDTAAFPVEFLDRIAGLAFAENYAQLVDCSGGWQEQWKLIQDFQFAQIAQNPG